MWQGWRRPTPAMIVSLIALFFAIGGSVYAAARIDGRSIRVRTLPGNRLKLGSVPANRLKRGILGGGLSGPLTGDDIDERSLGQVPSAAYAEAAGSAQTAVEAQTAQNAVNAVNASTVNGYDAGCQPGAQLFAGACWQSSASEAATTAPIAAGACATIGGSLPEALQLAAFAQEPGISLDGEEWSQGLTNFSGPNAYGVLTVSPSSDINLALSTATKHYRCVIPLVA